MNPNSVNVIDEAEEIRRFKILVLITVLIFVLIIIAINMFKCWRKTTHNETKADNESKQLVAACVTHSEDDDDHHKTCGICLGPVSCKEGHDRRYGILSNCNHSFCLACIIRWRQSTNVARNIARSCPECRVESQIVYPSNVWMNKDEDREKTINDFVKMANETDCAAYNRGRGMCVRGMDCLYRHVPDRQPSLNWIRRAVLAVCPDY